MWNCRQSILPGSGSVSSHTPLASSALGSSSMIRKKSGLSDTIPLLPAALGVHCWNEDLREREGRGIVWIDVGRSRRAPNETKEERVEEAMERKDSRREGDASGDKSRRSERVSGDPTNGSIG